MTPAAIKLIDRCRRISQLAQDLSVVFAQRGHVTDHRVDAGQGGGRRQRGRWTARRLNLVPPVTADEDRMQPQLVDAVHAGVCYAGDLQTLLKLLRS